MAGYRSVAAAASPPPVAGYLPHYAARFVSQAEQAAAKLPPTIKAQSLKNALLRQGAKPVELEYAGIDDFIAQQGPAVSSADVLEHIKREGPLGQLKRVEQQHEGPVEGIWGDGLPGELPEGGTVPGAPPRPPAYAPSIRQPFNPSTASNQTQYQNYTVPGKQGDFTGYREVLLEDPKNRPGGEPMVRPAEEQSADDANFLEYANRRLPDLDGAAPDQQPLQQEYQKLLNEAQMRGMMLAYRTDGTPFLEPNQTGGVIDAHSADYWARYNEYPDRIALQNIQSDVGQAASNAQPESPNMTMAEANDLIHRWDMGEIHADARVEQAGRMIGHPDFAEWMPPDAPPDFLEPRTAVSPLARDDNWKNLMARHIALQSIAGGGKPITIPTGGQMVDVEGFGMGTHGNQGNAARAASSYNEDLVRRLQKIFRGLAPNGASVDQPLRHEPYTPAIEHDKHLLYDQAAESRNNLRYELASRRSGATLGDMAQSQADALAVAEVALANRPDRTIYDTLRDMMSEGHAPHLIKDLEYAVQSPEVSPQFRDEAMKVLQHHYLMMERGPQKPIAADYSNVPGWTIRPSPEAVRAALQNGLPIMSLAPLLLAPAQEDQ